MAYFPQINSNMIITQVPYATASEFENLSTPVESGMVWGYALRSAGLPGYPTGSLSKFSVNFSSITDTEINTLWAFFQQMKGRWGTFRFLDPSGNLLQKSETFSDAAWTKTLTATSGAPDPAGHALGFTLSSGSMQAVIAAADGGMSGFMMCASIYLKALAPGVVATLGFKDMTTSTSYTTQFSLSTSSWQRISRNLVLPTDNQFVFYLSLTGSVYAFGAQVSPMKGEGSYACTPGNYGYRANARFDTDVFDVHAVAPGQSQLQLPIAEFNT